MIAKFIIGTESFDNYDRYLETLKDMGIERAVEIQQISYDEFMK